MVFTSSDPSSAGSALEKDILLYPNPAVEKISVHIPESLQVNKATIFDTIGQQRIQYDISGTQTRIDISTLPEGYYIVLLSSTNHLKYQLPFVKK
jgi:hypothetical protein